MSDKPNTNFERALTAILSEEGGYSNDPDDPGGATRHGITEAVARAHGYQGDMRHFPIDRAADIYRSSYWNKVRGDDLPWPMCLYVFDAAVNQGVEPAIRMMQRALDTTQDGIIGPTTLRLAKASAKWHHNRFMAFRCQRYVSTRNADKFLTGWLTRMFSIARSA